LSSTSHGVWPLKKFQGFDMTHLVIKRDDGGRLPMTNTGYISHFMAEQHYEEYASILDYVKAWLDHDAKSKEWKKYEVESQQLTLF